MTTQAQGADPAFAHDADRNPNWTPKAASRVYACEACGHQATIQTNHTGKVYSHRCGGRCRNILHPNTARETVLPAYTVHLYVREAEDTERDKALKIIFQEGRADLTATEAASLLDAVVSLARRLEAIYVRQCNGYKDESRRLADEVQEPRYVEALRAYFEGAGLTMTLNTDPRGSAVGISTPKTMRYNTPGGHSDGWKLDVEALSGRPSVEEEAAAQPELADVPTLVEKQRKAGNRLPISSQVMDVLQKATAEGDKVFLQGIRLPRDLYQEVNRVLTLAGGKWSHSHVAHRFPGEDAADVLDNLLTSGEVLDRKTALQAFFTPSSLATDVAIMADIKTGHRVLEPSAGEGAIAFAARRRGGEVECLDIDAKHVAKLEELGFTARLGDFLAVWPEAMFDRVVMNPPFTRQQDVRHVLHASQFLKPGGRLVAIMSPSAPMRTSGPGAEFLALVEAWGGTFKEVEAGAFKASGTDIATVILTLNCPEA